MNILDKIVAHKKVEVAQKKEMYPIPLLEKSTFFNGQSVSLSHYIKRPDKTGIIAEFKRKSPSKPSINLYADIEEVSIAYMQAGASALSVLTDGQFFGGKTQDLITARKYNFCPILRKDFIIDEYQVIEARSIGADAILLISEILTKEEVHQLASLATSLGMEVLLELHSASQLDKYSDKVQLIGVNNRDLDTFKTDVSFSKELYEKLPSGVTKVSESGIHDTQTVKDLKSIGYEGFLIGERFMTNDNPGDACKSFIQEIASI
ncbi:MAG: indole-3-glycerol phosphate synthase TrpC [Saprospiraceae bacterium]|nr:indole-3-glycerol phosphate synthase TrpC [Saprospiraceae bacterium]